MHKNYYKHFAFLYTTVLLFFLNSSFAFALETTYPSLPGFPAVTDKSNLPEYVAYFFGLAIAVAAILAVIFLAIGGLRLITSISSPSAHTDAWNTIKGAILGLLLLMAAFLILRTINPDFIEPVLTPLPDVDGIFYYDGTNKLPSPMSESNTRNVPEGYDRLIYVCSSGPSLFVWKFPETNFQGIDGAYTQAINCGDSINITDARSFNLAFESTGIYYCMGGCSETGTICSGLMSKTNTSSGQISEPFKNNVKSVLFVNDPTQALQYGAVFHFFDDPKQSGPCSFIYNLTSTDKKRSCFNMGSSPSSSVSVFAWNYKTPETSGAGANFYSEPWGNAVGARAGNYFLSSGNIKNYFHIPTNKIIFNYSGINRPTNYISLYQSFLQRPGSIYLEGNYLFVLNNLISTNDHGEKLFVCQIFYSDIFNIKETEFFAKENKIENIEILPIK